MHYYLTI